MKKQLNPTLVYILSAVGLLCCCFLGSGIFLAGPAFFIANKNIKDAEMNPDDYEGDIKGMKTAKIIALVVLVLNVLMVIRTIYVFSTVGYDGMMEIYNEALEQAQAQQNQ